MTNPIPPTSPITYNYDKLQISFVDDEGQNHFLDIKVNYGGRVADKETWEGMVKNILAQYDSNDEGRAAKILENKIKKHEVIRYRCSYNNNSELVKLERFHQKTSSTKASTKIIELTKDGKYKVSWEGKDKPEEVIDPAKTIDPGKTRLIGPFTHLSRLKKLAAQNLSKPSNQPPITPPPQVETPVAAGTPKNWETFDGGTIPASSLEALRDPKGDVDDAAISKYMQWLQDQLPAEEKSKFLFCSNVCRDLVPDSDEVPLPDQMLIDEIITASEKEALERIIIPYNISARNDDPTKETKGAHWVLVDIDLVKKEVHYYDSCKEVFRTPKVASAECSEKIGYIWKKIAEKKPDSKLMEKVGQEDWPFIIEKDIPKQENNHDCGAFVCKYAKNIASGLPQDKLNASMPTIRKEIADSILMSYPAP